MTTKKEKINPHAAPRITKVVLNVGVGKNRDDKKHIAQVLHDLAAITGQRPRERRARIAVAGFNVREGNVVGYSVTLRGKRMQDFVSKFIHVTLPRVRDFQGIRSASMDSSGNVSVGLPEQLAFPEIHPDKTDIIFGVEVTLVTSTEDRKAARRMLMGLGFPFRSKKKS